MESHPTPCTVLKSLYRLEQRAVTIASWSRVVRLQSMEAEKQRWCHQWAWSTNTSGWQRRSRTTNPVTALFTLCPCLASQHWLHKGNWRRSTNWCPYWSRDMGSQCISSRYVTIPCSFSVDLNIFYGKFMAQIYKWVALHQIRFIIPFRRSRM